MKTIDNGAFYTVTVSGQEVADFNSRWPCSPIPENRISFEFDKRNDDLVDITPDSSAFDGDALLALSQDAQEAGKKFLARHLAEQFALPL